jgi:hypothetical protein
MGLQVQQAGRGDWIDYLLVKIKSNLVPFLLLENFYFDLRDLII